jgi:hypothetical protein
MSADMAVMDWTATSTDVGACQTTYRTSQTQGGIGELLVALYGGYCRAVFEGLARTDPAELLSIVRHDRAADSRLTFAVEILGEHVRQPWVAGALLEIVASHRSPLVREGAVLGLSHHMERLGVRDALRARAAGDPSPGVRATAQDILDLD